MAHASERVQGRVVGGAFREAEALGHHWVGPTHLFLAILALEDESACSRVLARLSVRHDAVAQDFRASIASSDPPVEEPAGGDQAVRVNAAAYGLLGRADGLAVGLGAPEVTLEHLLIAYLWEAARTSVVQEVSGVEIQAVLDQLVHEGVPVPARPLPSPPRPRTRVFVPYEAMGDVHGHLMRRLPEDSGLGVNHDAKSRAWVVANDNVDLERHVLAILDELGLEPVAQADTS